MSQKTPEEMIDYIINAKHETEDVWEIKRQYYRHLEEVNWNIDPKVRAKVFLAVFCNCYYDN